jgi:hypothetical protein
MMKLIIIDYYLEISWGKLKRIKVREGCCVWHASIVDWKRQILENQIY